LKTQLEEINPGEAALVMCVDMKTYDYASKKEKSFQGVPILPHESHTDVGIINFPDEHYHYDFRFFPKELVTNLIGEHDEFIAEDPDEWLAVVQRADEVIGKPYLTELICLREMPVFPLNYKFSAKLERAYEQHSLVNNICPHKGYMTFESNCHGCDRICPGHGLGFKDGKVYKRSKFLRYN